MTSVPRQPRQLLLHRRQHVLLIGVRDVLGHLLAISPDWCLHMPASVAFLPDMGLITCSTVLPSAVSDVAGEAVAVGESALQPRQNLLAADCSLAARGPSPREADSLLCSLGNVPRRTSTRSRRPATLISTCCWISSGRCSRSVVSVIESSLSIFGHRRISSVPSLWNVNTCRRAWVF